MLEYKRPWWNRTLAPTTKPIFIRKNLESGLEDLARSARRDPVEACWLYAHTIGHWYNMVLGTRGEHQGQYAHHMGGASIRKFDLSQVDSALTLYHTHPQAILDQTYRKNMQKIQAKLAEGGGTTSEWLSSVVRKLVDLENCFPSEGDIDASVKMVQDNPSELDMRFGIVTQVCTTTFSVTPRYAAKDSALRYQRFTSRFFRSASKRENDHRIGTPVEALAQEYCGKLNQNALGLEFFVSPHASR